MQKRWNFLKTGFYEGIILGEAHATVHRVLTGLLAEGIVGRVSHGTAHLPSSQSCWSGRRPLGRLGSYRSAGKWSTLADAIWSQTGLRELEHTLLRENVQCTPPSSRRDIEVLSVVK